MIRRQVPHQLCVGEIDGKRQERLARDGPGDVGRHISGARQLPEAPLRADPRRRSEGA
jgi:hypothetical protein